MSIYATLWILKFPALGDAYFGCEWETVIAQAVPGHIGTSMQGHGYAQASRQIAGRPRRNPASPSLARCLSGIDQWPGTQATFDWRTDYDRNEPSPGAAAPHRSDS